MSMQQVMDMRVPNRHFREQRWLVHELAPDFILEDLWRFPIEAEQHHNLDQFRRQFAQAFETLARKGAPGFLFRLRTGLGKIFGWDKQPTGASTIREGSLRERYRFAYREDPPDLKPDETGPFEIVYERPDEYLSETCNATVHAALHLGWTKIDESRYTVHMAVLVKPTGPITSIYMALIKPFRHMIVYPAIMRATAEQWKRFAAKRPEVVAA